MLGLITKLFFILFLSFSPLLNGIIDEAVPYLLPDDHKIKPILDSIFTRSRAVLNCQSMKDAGFASCTPRQYTHVIVTTHPKLPGYVFKLVLDCQLRHKNQPETAFWARRAKGAELITKIIQEHGFESFFKVPKKWIYLLPENPKAPKGYAGRESILVEEDMNILSKDENKIKWKSDAVSHELLESLYVIIQEGKLADCLKPDNIPFSVDGKVAFVDTEIFNKKKVHYKKLKPFLSSENRRFWEELTGCR